jgi:hypothetical protein
MKRVPVGAEASAQGSRAERVGRSLQSNAARPPFRPRALALQANLL